jgi:hypothetical protein
MRPTLPCMLQPSDAIWELVTSCWDDNPESRPVMSGVLNNLKAVHGDQHSAEEIRRKQEEAQQAAEESLRKQEDNDRSKFFLT